MNVLGICAGVAGIELGLRIAEPAARPVCFVESDLFAQRILWQRYGAAIWDDIWTFHAEDWAGIVEIITAGFPCQPWSQTGVRRGILDPRWCWPAVARSIRIIRPRFVLLENVPGILKAGAGYVLSDLARMGFDVAWGMFSCRSLGASHIRKRWFALAHDPRQGWGERVSVSAGASGGLVSARDGLPFWAPGPQRRDLPPAYWVSESRVGGVADGFPSRLDSSWRNSANRAMGNSVSPPVGAVAWRILSSRLRANGGPPCCVIQD